MRAVLVLLCAGALGAGAGAIRPARTTPPTSGAVTNSITSFATSHPEWAVFRDGPPEDAAPLRLNHAVHLNPETTGMQAALAALLASGAPGATGVAPDADGRFSLTCVSCHRADDAGRYMRPISFDAHCAACHAEDLGRVNFAPGVAEPEAAPHGDVSRLVSLIDRKLLERATMERAKPAPAPVSAPPTGAPEAQPAPAAPSPGGARPGGRKSPGAKPTSAADAVPAFESPEQAGDWLLTQRADALRRFQTGCSKCHAGVTDPPESPKGSAFAIASPQIPDRWLPRSHFAHGAHEMLSCLACHEKAVSSERTQDILLPGIATCRECHAPPSARGSLARVGSALGFRNARGDHSAPGSCVTCHAYHPPANAGGDGGLSISEFLNVSAPRDSAPAAPGVSNSPDAPRPETAAPAPAPAP